VVFNVLIVDDSPDMRGFVRRVLELSGIPVGNCLGAADGREALDLLRAERVDLILTEIEMPVMDGEQMLRILAADCALRTIPVIVVSAHCTARAAETMQTLGAKGFLAKPFLPANLRAEVAKVLGNQLPKTNRPLRGSAPPSNTPSPM
jgi:two-component system, chemotaxis family, chemotaxis protein CheY